MRFRIALCAVVSSSLPVFAQTPMGGSSMPASMPGVPVGTGLNMSPSAVGQPTTPVGSKVGGQVGNGIAPPGIPSDFSKIDPSMLAAPLPTFGNAANLNFFQRMQQSVSNLFAPADTVPRPRWVPGITRRTRERMEERTWRRD